MVSRKASLQRSHRRGRKKGRARQGRLRRKMSQAMARQGLRAEDWLILAVALGLGLLVRNWG